MAFAQIRKYFVLLFTPNVIYNIFMVVFNSLSFH